MEPIVFRPPSIDFGVVPAADKPVSVDLMLENRSTSLLLLKFNPVSSKTIWFTRIDEITHTQRKTGFDIFFQSNKIENLTIYPHTQITISAVFIPSKATSSFPLTLRIPVLAYAYDSENTDSSGDGELIEGDSYPLYKTTIPLSVYATLSAATFKIDPPHIFMKDCIKDVLQTRKFTLKNMCDASLPVMIHSTPGVEIVTPKLQNFIELPPKASVELELRHNPVEVGQFEHKVQFHCLITKDRSQSLKLLTAVSPPHTPKDFPTIHPQSGKIDFGQIYAGEKTESTFTITNKGQSNYKVFVYGVIDTYLSGSVNANDSLTTSLGSTYFGSLNLIETPSIYFRTVLTPNPVEELLFNSDSDSSTTITLEYTPTFNLHASSSVLDSRTFMVMLQFTNNDDGQVYYKLLQCSASVCHSHITISPESMDFGDTVVANTFKKASFTITNLSPLPTLVKVTPAHRSIVAAPAPIEIGANMSVQVPFTFYPRRVNPEFQSQLIVSNLRNPQNIHDFQIQAIVVAGQKESIHSMSYSLSVNKQPINYINFEQCVSSYPALKCVVVKNKMNEELSLTVESSNPEELNVYTQIEADIPIPLSTSNSQVFQSTSSFAGGEGLLKRGGPVLTLQALERAMRPNSAFFLNPVDLMTKSDRRQLVEHFEAIAENYEQAVLAPTVSCFTNGVLKVAPSSKAYVYVGFVPSPSKANQTMWVHRRESLKLKLNNVEDSEPLVLPVSVNVASSLSFLSSHSLNFGHVLSGSIAQHNIFMANESALPLLFRIEADRNITIDKHPSGVVLPLSSISVPFTLTPDIDGKLLAEIRVRNILNPEERQTIAIKADVIRSSNFYMHPSEIDFGTVTAGSCSAPVQIFITNTSKDEENEFTFSHVYKDRTVCRPLVMFQIRNLTERRQTEAVQVQIEKLKCKVRILTRKKKLARVAALQRVIDDLSNTTVQASETRLKQLDAKYMDRLLIRADPLQIHCIELQLIPSLVVGRRLPIPMDIEGVVLVSENGRTETQRVIKYRAHVVPEAKRILDSAVQHSITVEPSNFDFGEVAVHQTLQRMLHISNSSNTQQNYWISANSGSDAIITTAVNEGFLKFNESVDIPVAVFCLQPGRIVKEITVTTLTSSIKVPLTANCSYPNVLAFSGVESGCLDFGSIPLTTLRIIEERRSFSIQNISENPIFVFLRNSQPADMLVYEKDPKTPLIRPFKLSPLDSCNVNVLLKPELDREMYRCYKSTIIEASVSVMVFEGEEDAEAYCAKPTEAPDVLFMSKIAVKATIGRIGLLPSETNIMFGAVKQINEVVEGRLQIKNRSSHIPLSVVCTCTQGLSVSQTMFTLSGRKAQQHSQEVVLRFQPSTWGLNEATLHFSTSAPIQYTKNVTAVAFADPGYLETGLPVNAKGIDELDLGGVYVVGKPIPVHCRIPLTNRTSSTLRVEFPGLKQKLLIKGRETAQLEFNFPLYDGFYDPEEPRFALQLLCQNSLTKTVLKVIEIVGEFGTSLGSLAPDTVDFERFGNVNQWQFEHQQFVVTNSSNVPLHLVATEISKYLQLPTEIIVGPQGRLAIPIEPAIPELRTVEGCVKAVAKYSNANNPTNFLQLSVGFDISANFLRFDHIEEGPHIEINKLKRVEGENGVVTAGNAWFGVTSCAVDEAEIGVTVREYKQEKAVIELFLRNSDQKLSKLLLQPSERVELRVRLTVLEGVELAAERDPCVCDIIFEIAGAEPLVVPVYYEPKVSIPAPPPLPPIQPPEEHPID